ncbi:MAG: hypothetical protein ABIY70_08640 [Capsulimonas sp.]|uniref:hypothetical protein n=1 Tax=Capsulimonas sp. TaxID=2494211 RepID=UPI003264410C
MTFVKGKPTFLYYPITRVDEAERIVEGYAFVNEVVDGEGGVRLKRSAMIDATADYMNWGALREMHGSNAAGTMVSVVWDERGAFVRAKVVDDAAWKKVTEGVYKGFSVGVAPKVMRGLDVEKCLWGETSLVDRPKDTDAKFLCFRAETMTDEIEIDQLDEATVIAIKAAEAGDETQTSEPHTSETQIEEVPTEEIQPTVGDEPPAASTTEENEASDLQRAEDLVVTEVLVVEAVAPASFSARMSQDAMWEYGYEASDALFSALLDIAYTDLPNKEDLARASIEQFTNYIVPMVAGSSLPKERRAVTSEVVTGAIDPALTRGQGGENPETARIARVEGDLEADRSRSNAAFNRLDGVDSTLSRLQGEFLGLEGTVTTVKTDLTGILERIANLEKAPMPLIAPMRGGAHNGGERSFTANTDPDAPQNGVTKELLQRRMEQLKDLVNEPDAAKREAGAVEMQQIKMALQRLG